MAKFYGWSVVRAAPERCFRREPPHVPMATLTEFGGFWPCWSKKRDAAWWAVYLSLKYDDGSFFTVVPMPSTMWDGKRAAIEAA